MRLHCANITNFGKQILDWIWSRDNEIYILLETHMDQQRHASMRQYFGVRADMLLAHRPRTMTMKARMEAY